MPTKFEEQQKALRATVPKGSAAAADLERQGFTDVGTDTTLPFMGGTQEKTLPFMGGVTDIKKETLQPNTSLSKVGTSAVGPDGKPIYDVFAGQEHIQDPSDPRLKGIDIAGLPEGTAPKEFKSKFETGFDEAKADLGDKAGD